MKKTKEPKEKRKWLERKVDASPLLTMPQLLALVPYSKATIYVMVERGEFPAQRQIGPRRVAWVRKEIDAWIKEKIAQ